MNSQFKTRLPSQSQKEKREHKNSKCVKTTSLADVLFTCSFSWKCKGCSKLISFSNGRTFPSYIRWNISKASKSLHYRGTWKNVEVTSFPGRDVGMYLCYDCCRCLNSWQSAPTSFSAKKSLGAILVNINLKPTDVEFVLLLSLVEASFEREPIK